MGNAKDFEWARERIKREKERPTNLKNNRTDYLLREVRRTDGEKAVREIRKEFGI